MKGRSVHILLLSLMLGTIAPFQLTAQKEKTHLKSGNKAFEKGDMKGALDSYNKALEIAPSFGKAQYNLGSTHYKAGELKEAAEKYEIAAADAIDKKEKAWAFHNQGNCYLNAAIHLMDSPPPPDTTGQSPPDPQKFIKKSIQSYKQALRNDPTDEDARYNLAYAKKLVVENEGGEGQENQDQNQEKEDKKKENEEKEDEEKDGDENKDEESKNSDEQGDEQKEQEGKKGEMTPEEAERILDALQKEEKDLQRKKGKERINGEKIKIEKDW